MSVLAAGHSKNEARSELAGRRIAILLPKVWGVRNVVTSGLAERLAESGVHVVLLPLKREGWESVAPSHPRIETQSLLRPAPGWRAPGRHLIGAVLRAAFERRNRLREQHETIRTLMNDVETERGRRAGAGVRQVPIPKTSLRDRLANAVGFFCQPHCIHRRLLGLREALYKRENDLTPVRGQLEAIRPDLIYSTVCVDYREYPYLLAARERGVPVVTSILSFDNLTTRSEIPLYDHYTVWNERMRGDLLRIYPQVRPEQVSITGTPQFDFHRRPEFHWSRAETLRRLELPDDARYILYAANAVEWTPTEPDLVAMFAERLSAQADLRDLWIVVRLHPLDDAARWQPLIDRGCRLRVCSPWHVPPDRDAWSPLIPDDQRLLVSSLAHSVACVNMCSTMSLDAAILDRPVIGIAFASVPDSPEDRMYREAYRSHHYRPLVESQGLRLAHQWDELLRLVRDALNTPERDGEFRRRMVERECGLVDGRATDRIVEALEDFLLSPASQGVQRGAASLSLQGRGNRG